MGGTGALKGARLSRVVNAASGRLRFTQTSKEADLRRLRRQHHQPHRRHQVPLTTRSLLARATKWPYRSRALMDRRAPLTVTPRLAPLTFLLERRQSQVACSKTRVQAANIVLLLAPSEAVQQAPRAVA